MDYSHLISFLDNFIAENIWLSNNATVDWLTQVLLLNIRAFLLLLGCLILLHVIKGSASTRHFLISVTIVSILILPVSMQLIPEIDIEVETPEAQAITSLIYMSPDITRHNDILSLDLLGPICLLLYLSGFAFISVKILIDNFKTYILIKFCRPVGQRYWLLAVDKHSRNYKIRRKVQLRYSDAIKSPSTWGVLCPVILVPTGALQWPDELIESTILHELAHIKRNDWLVLQMARCVCAVYWLNPFCLLAFRKLCMNAEIACDDLAINSGVKNTRYARSLVNAAKRILQHQKYNFATLAMAGPNKSSQLGNRIMAILNFKEKHGQTTKKQIGSIILVFTFLLVPLASLQTNFVEANNKTAMTDFYKNLVFIRLGTLSDLPGKQNSNVDFPDSKPAEFKKLVTPAEPPIDNNINMKESSILIHKKNVEKAGNTSFENRHMVSDSNSDINIEIDPDIERSKLIETNAIVNTDIDGYGAGIPSVPGIPEKIVVDHVPKNMIVPKYPNWALYRGLEGEVTVEYSIDEYGRVIDAKIISASPKNTFDHQVLKAIRKSTFTPRKINGKPVLTEGLVEKYTFVMES